MMDERIGIMGKTHGVRERRRPKVKKVSSTSPTWPSIKRFFLALQGKSICIDN